MRGRDHRETEQEGPCTWMISHHLCRTFTGHTGQPWGTEPLEAVREAAKPGLVSITEEQRESTQAKVWNPRQPWNWAALELGC
jgi:hypothetical protein